MGGAVFFDVNEAVCLDELGRSAQAAPSFARFAETTDPFVAVRYVRHLLRTGRIREAAAAAEKWANSPSANFFWPYLAAAWRLLDDGRWEWLEGQPGLVGTYDLSSAIPSLDALADRLRGLHNFIGQPLEQSVRGGTQTDGNLFARAEPEIRALRAAIVEAVREHVAGLPAPDPRHPQLACPRAPIRFSGSWSVRLTGQGHHANHIHPAGWFSSAFYVTLPDEAERGGRVLVTGEAASMDLAFATGRGPALVADLEGRAPLVRDEAVNDVGGAVISKTTEHDEAVRFMQNSSGGIMSPQVAWLTLQGIKTLPIRLRAQSQNAARIATSVLP